MIERLDYVPAAIHLHVTSEPERRMRVHSCKKETETVAWIESLDRGVLFDIGANTGSYSFVAAANGHDVHAFEPPGPTFDRLEQNIDLNSELRVWAYPALLGDKDEWVDFSFSSLEPGAALHSLGGGGAHTEKLFMSRLDEYVEKKNLPKPDYLKIDVDGSELRVLIGARDCLESVKSLLVEVDPVLPMSLQVQPFLEGHGFQVVSEHPHVGSGVVNTVFGR